MHTCHKFRIAIPDILLSNAIVFFSSEKCIEYLANSEYNAGGLYMYKGNYQNRDALNKAIVWTISLSCLCIMLDCIVTFHMHLNGSLLYDSCFVVLRFYVPPSPKVIWRQDLGLESHLKDWRIPGLNWRCLVYKASCLTTTPWRRMTVAVIQWIMPNKKHNVTDLYIKRSVCEDDHSDGIYQ